MTDRSEDSVYPDDDPRRIRSLAVTTEDVVSALEANVRRDVGAVLRVTPPFNPRARARLHVAGGEGEYGDQRPLHIDPSDLVEGTPPYPTPDSTEDRLRQAGEYTPERHREQHVEAVETWRRDVASAIVSSVTVSTADGDHAVEVKALG